MLLVFLIFSLRGARYAVDARFVQEVFWLPELTAVEEAPPHVAGVVNLRGRIEPVMDLGLRFGHPLQPYSLTDRVILLQAEETTMGMIVNDIHDVLELPDSECQSSPRYDETDAADHTHFVSGEIKLDDDVAMMLDVTRLLHAPALTGAACGMPADVAGVFQGMPPELREVFRARRHRLGQVPEEDVAADLLFVAVIELGGEHFGVELDVVREFSHLRRITPVPCCPSHIVGNMNLRGDILTLVDLRPLLNLALASAADTVMVIEANGMRLGIPVSSVLEVQGMHMADVVALPAASRASGGEYCKSAAPYGGGMISILDVQKILAQGGIEVGEEV